MPYNAQTAHSLAERRKKKTNKRKLDKIGNEKLKEYVERRLLADWSPQQIAGRLKEKPPDDLEETISYESIYDYIYNGAEKYKRLYEHLRTARK